MKGLLKSLNIFLGLTYILFSFYGMCHAESVVDEGSAMVFIEPLQDLPESGNPTGWTALDYDTGQDEGKGDPDNGSLGWQVGTYGVGYGDNDDNTAIYDDSSVYSVYTRAEFNVADVSEAVSMSLGVDYDDGFIAWINGVEVARSPSMEGVSPVYNAPSGPHEASLTNPPTYEEFDISAFTASLVNGRNVLAIGVWNNIPNSSDLSLIPRLSLFYSSSTSPVLIRYPYIQKATSDSVTIVWNTDVESDSTVEYGPSYGSVAYDADSVTQHVVALTGLSPGTTYYYRVSSDGTVLTSSGTFFQTNKDQGASFTFVVIGDSGQASPGQSEVAQLIEDAQPDLMLHTGDVIYGDIASPSTGGEAENYDAKFFMPYKDTIKRVSLYPTLGNHDINTLNGQPYLDAFILPADESGSGTERYYSFDYANAHFISLDLESSDYTIGSDQYNWLVNDLSTTDKTWKFVYFHRPLYSSNTTPGHGSYTEIREILSPLFEQYGVDMVFFGHSHHYERTYPLIEDAESADGITYVVTGGGGGPLADPSDLVGGNPWSAYFESTYHLVKISIDGGNLSLEAVKPDGSSNGEVFDSYTITKKPITHTLTPPSDTTVSPGELLGPFYASLTNNTGSYYEFYAQPYFVTASGVTRYATQRLLRFDAGETRDFTRYISVPTLAQEGTCTFGVILTETGGSLISDNSFDFTVVSGAPLARNKSSKGLRRLMKAPGAHVVESDGWKMIIMSRNR